MTLTLSPDTAQNNLAALLRDDATVAMALPGLVWTRPIRRNDNPHGVPASPGSTPEAFDGAGRIRRCVAVLPGEASANPIGPDGAYYGFPEIWLRCLPHESEKAALYAVMDRIGALVAGTVLPGLRGEGLILRVAGRMGLVDDAVIEPAVVGLIRVQIDSVWHR